MSSDLQAFDEQNQRVEKSLLGHVQLAQTIVVSKNDSMKKRVEQVLSHAQSGTNVLLIARSNAMAKLIGILEIAKSKHHFSHHNKVATFTSEVDPTKKESTGVREVTSENYTDADLVDLGIKAPKTFTIPVMYVLVGKKMEGSLGWTQQ